MFKVVFVTCYCVISLFLPGLIDGKPIERYQFSDENPQSTTIQIPRAIISGEELVALAKYVMRMMASRINITLQATTSHTDFPRFSHNVPFNTGIGQSTTPAIIPSKDYETFGNTREIDYEVTRCADLKLQYPCRTVEGTEKLRPLVKNQGPHPTTNEPPSSIYGPFLKYGGTNVESLQNQFDFEIIPNLEIPTTYIPQVEKNTGVLPLMEQVLNTPLPPPEITTMASGEEKDSHPSTMRIIRNSTLEQVSSLKSGNSLVSVPFEAVITFTGRKPLSPEVEIEDENIVIPTRNPPDEFPPYFETVLPVKKKTKNSSSGSISSNLMDKNKNPAGNNVDELGLGEKLEYFKPTKKQRTPKFGELLEKFALSMNRSRRNQKGDIRSTTSPPVAQPSRNMRAPNFSNFKPQKNTTIPPKRGPMFQRQEIEDEEDEDEEGPLAFIADLLPLALPIFEDLSDPNTETDIAEVLKAAIPLIEGISQGDDETDGVDVVQLVSPIFAGLSAPNRNGNGTVLQTILPLIIPFVAPFIGPIIGPLIQASANPTDQGGSSITPLLQAFAGPLSLPTQPGGISIGSSLISGIIASLSRDLKAAGNGGSDIGAFISTVVSGVLAGGSAGIKSKFMKPPPPHVRPGHGYAAYGQGPVPASSVNPLDLVGTSIKEILGLIFELIKSVVYSVTEILGASSSKKTQPAYGSPIENFRTTQLEDKKKMNKINEQLYL